MFRRFHLYHYRHRTLWRLRHRHKRAQLLRVHLQPWSLKPCSNRKTPPLRDDPEWGIEKQMEDGVYHGVRKDIGGRPSRLPAGYLAPSKYYVLHCILVTSLTLTHRLYNYLPLVDLRLSLL
jgi:hypothetical protein